MHSLTLQGHVDLSIRTYALDVSAQTVTGMQGAEKFVFVKQTTVLIVYNDLKSQIGFLPDQYIHFCSRLIRWHFLGEIALHLGRSHDAIAVFVHMKVHNIALSFLHLHFLFTERNKQVFQQSPVEKSSEVIHPGHLKISEIAHHRLRSFCGGNQALLTVEIEEYVQFIANLASLWNELERKQNLAFHPSVEIKAEINLLDYLQTVYLT